MMSQVFLVLSSSFILLCVIQGSESQKSGTCLPISNPNICRNTCLSDYECAGRMKCCPTYCGGTICAPVYQRKPKIAAAPVKAGICPKKPEGPWVCSNRCGKDSDCRGDKKCCKNRCGAMACIKPEAENDLFPAK